MPRELNLPKPKKYPWIRRTIKPSDKLEEPKAVPWGSLPEHWWDEGILRPEPKIATEPYRVPFWGTEAEHYLPSGEIKPSPYELPEGFSIDATTGYTTTDTGWTITPQNFYKDPEGHWHTAEEMQSTFELTEQLASIFPEQDIAEVIAWAEEDPERFVAAFRQIGNTPEARAVLQRIGLDEENINRILIEPTIWEMAEEAPMWQAPSFAYMKQLEGKPWYIKFIGTVFGAPGIVSPRAQLYIAGGLGTGLRYVEGWWKTALMELGFGFYKTLQTAFRPETPQEYRWVSEAEGIMDAAFKKHGWKAIFTEEVNEAWSTYFEEVDAPKAVEVFCEFANPTWWIPLGGAAGMLAKFTTKVPVLGKTMQALAKSVRLGEKAIALPLTLPVRGAKRIAKEIVKAAPRRRYLLEQLPTQVELRTWLFKNDVFQHVATKLKLPALGELMPAAAVGELPQRLYTKLHMEAAVTQFRVMQVALLEMGQGMRGQALSFLRDLGTTRKILGCKNGWCSAKLVRAKAEFPNSSLALGDVVQAPERYIFRHKHGYQYCKRSQQMCREVYELATAEGVDIKKVGLESFEEFVHWVCLGRKDRFGELEVLRQGTRLVGAKPPSLKHRRFETMAEGIRQGNVYADDLEIYVGGYIDDLFKLIADRRLGQGLAEVRARMAPEAFATMAPVTPLERLWAKYPQQAAAWDAIKLESANTGYVLSALNRAARGEVLPFATLQKLDRISPNAGHLLRQVYATRTPVAARTPTINDMARVYVEKGGREISWKDAALLDDALKLKADELGVSLFEGRATVQVMEEAWAANPLKRFIACVPKVDRGGIPYLTVTQYRILTGAKYVMQEMKIAGKTVKRRVLLGGKEPVPAIMMPDGKRVRWEYAFDTVAQELGYERGAANRMSNLMPDEHFVQDLTKTADEGHLIAQTRAVLAADEAAYAHLTELAKSIKARLEIVAPPGETSTLAAFMKRATAPETTSGSIEALARLKKEVALQLEALKPKMWQTRYERKVAMEIVSQPGVGEDMIRTASGRPHPMFSGQIYPKELAEKASKLLNDEANIFWKKTGDVSASLRLMEAAFDVSAPWIQGFVAHCSQPHHAIRADLYSLGAFIDPRLLGKYRAKHAVSMNERLFYLGRDASFEYLEALKGFQRWFAKLPEGKPVLAQTYGRGEASFTAWSTVFKDLMWQANGSKWIRTGQGADFAHYLEIMSGQLSMERLGMSANLRAFLSGWVSFAPSYRLAVTSWFLHSFHGGMIGGQARKDMAKMILAAHVAYYGICEASGQKAYLNPWTDGKKYMSMNIDGHWVGMGGAVISLIRAWADITASMLSIGENEPADFKTWDKWKNPLLRSWFTQSAVLPSMLYEMITRADYMGYPMETVEDWAKWGAEKLSPIWTQDLLFDKSGVPPTPLSVLGEFVGWRTSPETRWERLDIKLKEVGAWEIVSMLSASQRERIQAGETVLSVLGRDQKAEMFNAFPELIELHDQAVADAERRSSKEYQDLVQSTRRFREEAVTDMNLAWDAVAAGEKDMEWLRSRYTEIMQNYGAKLDAIREVDAYQDIYDEWEEERLKRIENATLIDMAYWEYIETVVSPEFKTEAGDYDFEARRAALDDFKAYWGETIYDKMIFILENNKEDYPEWAMRLWQDRRKLDESAYWDLPSKKIKSMTERDEWMGKIPAKYLDDWREYQTRTSDIQRESFLAAHPDFDRDFRQEFALENPEIDALLIFWGYKKTPQTKEALDMALSWAHEWNLSDEAITRSLSLPPEKVRGEYWEWLELVKEHGGVGPEAKLFKLDHSAFMEYGEDAYGWQPVTDRREILEIDVKWKELDEKYDAIHEDAKAGVSAYTVKVRHEKILADNPEYAKARREREGYQIGMGEYAVKHNIIPSELMAAYVEYYTTDWPSERHADERYLLEHKDLYDALIDLEIRKSEIDPEKIWPEDFETWYWGDYRTISTEDAGRARYQLRGRNPEMDAWGVKFMLWREYDPRDWRAGKGYIPPPPKRKQKIKLPNPLGSGYGKEVGAAEWGSLPEHYWPSGELKAMPQEEAEDRGAALHEMAQTIYGDEFFASLKIELGVDPSTLTEEQLVAIEAKVLKQRVIDPIAFDRSQWLYNWNVPKSEWDDWEKHLIEATKLPPDKWGWYHPGYMAEGVPPEAAKRMEEHGVGAPTIKVEPGRTPVEVYGHEFAHANYFEQMPEGMRKLYPTAHALAQFISPIYKNVLKHYPDGKAYLPIEGYAEAYAHLVGRGEERLPWYMEPFYGNLLYAVPDLPGDMEKTALAWLVCWMHDKIQPKEAREPWFRPNAH